MQGTMLTDTERLRALYLKRFRARYRHQQEKPKGNVYREVRKLLGFSQTQAANALGVTRQAWQYREKVKVMYYPLELLVLWQMSGLSREEYFELLNDIA